MTRTRSAAGAALLLVVTACSALHDGRAEQARSARRRVILIIVDGLDARDVADEDTPFLARAWRQSRWCPGAHGRAAMPARTNTNHATLLTGVTPAVHGITGNAFWGRRTGERPRKLGAAVDLLAETLFTIAHASVPPLPTAAAVGKAKLDVMFAAAAGQSAPTRTWSPKDAAESAREPVTGYAFDAATLAGARILLDGEPSFVLVNLADVDRVSHGAGPHSAAASATRRATDHALAKFLGDLGQRPGWRDTTVVVTADHGFDTIEHPPVDVAGRLLAELGADLVGVNDGGVAHVYLRDRARAGAADLLARARRLALTVPGIAEAFYLAANPVDGGDAHRLGAVHPEWHLEQERVGDLLLVAAPGYVLADTSGDEARLKGNHGAPAELDVPVIVIGGAASAEGEACLGVTAADLGRTLMACLGLRDAHAWGDRPVADVERGRIRTGLCS